MNTKLLLFLLALLPLSISDNILVILDNKQLLKTHTKLFTHLKQSHTVSIQYSFSKQKIQLKTYDRFKYQHVIIMCLGDKESSNQIKINDVISYFDQGGNVVIVGDIDTDKSNRRLFQAFGVELDQYGSKLKDYFHYHQSVDVLKTENYVDGPFLQLTKPLLYQGTGINLANYVNYQLYQLVSSQSTALSRNYITQETTKIGRGSLVAGVQGLNNARAMLLGSVYFMSDDAFSFEEFDNEKAVKDLLGWVFHKSGVIRASNMKYYGEGAGGQKEILFNVGEKIYYYVDVQIQHDGKWQPYITDDLQVEFVMLDPWVRIPLVNVIGTAIYNAEFYAPLKQGIYQFKIIYRKPGFTFIGESQRVTVRPYKHDEYQRFLVVAYPYQFSLSLTIISTFIFMIIYLYTYGSSKKIKQD